MVKDVCPGVGGGPNSLYSIHGQLFFGGNNGTAGPEPWRSNGTSAGTVIIQDVIANVGSNPVSFAEANGKLFAIMSIVIKRGSH